jgi:hypothetical protein
MVTRSTRSKQNVNGELSHLPRRTFWPVQGSEIEPWPPDGDGESGRVIRPTVLAYFDP